MKAKKKLTRPNMKSFEADEDVAKMLEQIIASGATLRDVVNAAVRAHGPDILKRRIKELRSCAADIEKTISEGKH